MFYLSTHGFVRCAFCLLVGVSFAGSSPTLYAQTTTTTTSTATAASAGTQIASAKEPDEAVALAQALTVAGKEEAGSSDAAASSNGEGPAGIVPAKKGFNASIGTTSQHDAAAGWSSLLTPNVAWRFDRHFSVNAGLPVYTYLNVSSSKALLTIPVTYTYSLHTEHFILGDTTIAGQFEAHPKLFDYNVTAAMGIPTGNDKDGIGAGVFTYNVNNHFEHPIFDWLIPELELGIDNSPNLNNQRVRKSYIDVGTNAHFQFGFGFSLPFNSTFTTDAYEELPLSTQTITSETTNGKKGKQLKVITTSSEKSIGEDNGFLNTLDIPLNPHITLSGFYNRSLRDHDDTAGFSFTFTLRGTPHAKDDVH